MDYFDVSDDPIKLYRLESFGPISSMEMSSDKSRLIVGTENGIILNYQIYAIKKKRMEEDY